MSLLNLYFRFCEYYYWQPLTVTFTAGAAAPEAPYMTVLTKNVIGVICVIVISFQLWALIFLRDHM